MSRLNKGEWSEIYAIVSLLLAPELTICDAKLNEITKSLYDLKKIKVKDKTAAGIDYVLDNDFSVKVIYDNEVKTAISKEELTKIKNKLLAEIQNTDAHTGAFKIEGVEHILDQLSDGNILKASSYTKEDLEAVVVDKNLSKLATLKYSIKSSLGNAATILNASKRTNFLYEVNGLTDEDIFEINQINTKTKLIDRLNAIEKLGGKIKFIEVPDKNFDFNLKMIDSNLPNYLADVLLMSYR